MVKGGIAVGALLLAAVAGATAAFAQQGAHPVDGSDAVLDVGGIDHIGINVPDAGKSAQFFHDLIGTRVVSDWRPAPVKKQWKRRFRWHAGARLNRLMMIEARDGSKIELFEYASPIASHKQPHEDDASATHIALKAHDPARALAAVRAIGLPVLNDPVTLSDGSRWFYFLSPWGSQIELVFPPGK
ncbi:VOC family protein [Novosphingobium sp. BL-8A]|uniref:VOC family protein n=1 Tax=Novosphingobium sp. BL-8A TaxID=3127639 RepID=UPI0037570AAC